MQIEGILTLKDSLTDELDYYLVPQAAWDKLVSWYSLAEGQVCDDLFILLCLYRLFLTIYYLARNFTN